MLLNCYDRFFVVICDACGLGCLASKQFGRGVFGPGLRAERSAALHGWPRRDVEVSEGRGRLFSRLLHLCPGCSTVPGPVTEGI